MKTLSSERILHFNFKTNNKVNMVFVTLSDKVSAKLEPFQELPDSINNSQYASLTCHIQCTVKISEGWMNQQDVCT